MEDAEIREFFAEFLTRRRNCPLSDGQRRTYMSTSLGDRKYTMEQDFKVSLNDLYCGVEKKIRLKYDDMTKNQELSFIIAPGCREGVRIRFENQAWFPEQRDYGDLILILKEKKHEKFQRRVLAFPDRQDYRPDNKRYADLVYFLDITPHEAILGFTKQIEQLDGRTIDIYYEGVDAENFEEIIIKEEGMPIRRLGKIVGRGDLYIRLNVVF